MQYQVVQVTHLGDAAGEMAGPFAGSALSEFLNWGSSALQNYISPPKTEGK